MSEGGVLSPDFIRRFTEALEKPEGWWVVIGVSTWNYIDVQVGAVTPSYG